MNKKGFLKHLDFFIIGVLSLIIAFFVASAINTTVDFDLGSDLYRLLLIYELLSYIVMTYFYNPYSDILKKDKFSIAYGTVVFGLLQLALVTFLLFAIKEGATISRLYLATQYTCYTVFSFVLDIVRIRFLKKRVKESNKLNGPKLLVVTSKKRLDDCINGILKYNYDLYNVVGLCIFDDDSNTLEYKGYKVVCSRDSLLSYVCANWVDSVYLDIKYSDIPSGVLSGLATMGITTHLRLSKITSLIGQEQRAESLFNEPVLTSLVKHRSNKQIFRKKCIDLLGGIVGSLITLVLTIFIGPIIKIKSPGPIFYKQERIGLNGRHFYMYKFRSMVPNAEAHLKELEANNRVKDGLMFKMEDDPRIIPGIGTFIRKTSLDEFPQFFNVLKGDMSLVGTRPPTVNEWEKYDLKHRIRMSIKPGITGLWQVSGRNQITDFDEVVRLDKEYIENWHIGLDIKIILKTIKVIFVRKKGESM